MLSEQSREHTIFRRANPEDKLEVLKRFRWPSSRFTFDECLDHSNFLFLIEQIWSGTRARYILEGYVVAHKNKCEHDAIAEILHWDFAFQYHSVESMWITTLEQLYAEGINNINSPAAVALAFPTQRTLSTEDVAALIQRNNVLTFHDMVKHLEEFSGLIPDLLQLILSYSFFPQNTCRVTRGKSSCDDRTDDIVWGVAEILGWNDKNVRETAYLVRHYTHYNASHLISCDDCTEFSQTWTSGFSIMRLTTKTAQ